jgi:hypothetical protein
MAFVHRDESVFSKVRLADVLTIEKIDESFWFGNPPSLLRNVRQGVHANVNIACGLKISRF